MSINCRVLLKNNFKHKKTWMHIKCTPLRNNKPFNKINITFLLIFCSSFTTFFFWLSFLSSFSCYYFCFSFVFVVFSLSTVFTMLYLDHNGTALRNIFSSSRLNQSKKKRSLSIPIDTDFSKVILIISCYYSDVTTSIPSQSEYEKAAFVNSTVYPQPSHGALHWQCVGCCSFYDMVYVYVYTYVHRL